MSSPERPSSRERGFTLIEIIVVVGILMVIISVFAVGMARTIASSRAVFKMNMLAAYFADARALASATASIHASGSSLQFEYDPAKNVTTVTVFKYRPSTSLFRLRSPIKEKGMASLEVGGFIAPKMKGVDNSHAYAVLFASSGPVDFMNGRVERASTRPRFTFLPCAAKEVVFEVKNTSEKLRNVVLDCESGDLLPSE